jgi:hypothetical protein
VEVLTQLQAPMLLAFCDRIALQLEETRAGIRNPGLTHKSQN